MNAQPNDMPSHSWLGAPIDARSLFAPEQAALMAALRGLAPADWGKEAVRFPRRAGGADQLVREG
ncbi:hypothetical protein ACIBL5_34505 [Streptomyces sp. NPDC050516]|uniref:hypothetical protein n=1 Tax=Streptomyces sp. NPDC050516 TaxID=3365621 RepID=UPI00378D259D